jgi:hypothetical protein
LFHVESGGGNGINQPRRGGGIPIFHRLFIVNRSAGILNKQHYYSFLWIFKTFFQYPDKQTNNKLTHSQPKEG